MDIEKFLASKEFEKIRNKKDNLVKKMYMNHKTNMYVKFFENGEWLVGMLGTDEKGELREWYRRINQILKENMGLNSIK